MRRILILLYVCMVTHVLFFSHEISQTIVYDGYRGMNLWHTTKILQDKTGFIWISSWEGLTRFDGYDFVTFKSKAGDGSRLSSNRVRDIELAKNNDIYCLVDERWFVFSQQKGAFGPISDAVNKRLIFQKKKKTEAVHKKKQNKPVRTFTDRQGNLWRLSGDSLIRISSYATPSVSWNLHKPAQVRCIYIDKNHHYWITTKDDHTVCLYDAVNRRLGYLTPQGKLSSVYTPFSASVYSMLQTSKDTYLLGTKPDGLFRLVDSGPKYSVTHVSLGSEMANSVYDLKQDGMGRVWIATFDGIYCCQGGTYKHVGATKGWRVRNLHITSDGILLAATTKGLAVGKLPAKDIEKMSFRLHQREANRTSSLSNSATMDILEMKGGQFFVSTESGGVDQILSHNLLAKQLDFAHYDKTSGLASETIVAMAPYRNDWIWIVGGNCLMMLNTKTHEVKNFDNGYFHESYRYSDAHPMRLPDGRWIFGLQNGAFTLTDKELRGNYKEPQIVFTGYSIEYAPMVYHVVGVDKLVLDSHQRNLQIRFSALDFTNAENIRYAFRLHADDPWIYLGKEHSITLPNIQPGDYLLQVKCTNRDGAWIQNAKNLQIHVTPKFSETLWARILEVLAILSLTIGGVYTYLYIQSIKKRERETLQAYLSLLENEHQEPLGSEPISAVGSSQVEITEEDDMLMKRVMQFIDSHISESEIGITEIADAVAISRSGLNRKVKKIVGLTPAELLRETRIKHSQQLLLNTSMSVSEIAYACGFNDPKYFGKIFRQLTKMSPTDYRQK